RECRADPMMKVELITRIVFCVFRIISHRGSVAPAECNHTTALQALSSVLFTQRLCKSPRVSKGDMRISVPKRECGRARGREHSGIALAYARASAFAGKDACVPVFSPLLAAAHPA
ncbi:MAG: hypothetical protein ACRD6X_21840, partial [Pyrinomonadaceae bacterium]